MPSVVLYNKRGPRIDISLLHDVVCKRLQSCSCIAQDIMLPTGKIGQQKLPASVSICAGQRSDPLPVEVMHLGQLKALESRGNLVVIPVPDKHMPAPAATPPLISSPPPGVLVAK